MLRELVTKNKLGITNGKINFDGLKLICVKGNVGDTLVDVYVEGLGRKVTALLTDVETLMAAESMTVYTLDVKNTQNVTTKFVKIPAVIGQYLYFVGYTNKEDGNAILYVNHDDVGNLVVDYDQLEAMLTDLNLIA